MKKTFLSGLIAGFVLLILSVAGLYLLLWQMPDMAMEYFGPAFISPDRRNVLYYVHPFIIAICLLWLWRQFQHIFKGSIIIKSLKFGMVYMTIATFPYMLLIYSAIDVSWLIILSWLIFGFVEATVGAIIFYQIHSQ